MRNPSIIVTGASGIVGKNFLEAAKNNFLIYAFARRSMKEAGISPHKNIKWIQVDIADWISLRWIMHNIKREGGADYLLHLAGYYDFDYTPNPEYERTNIKGTKYILEQAKILRVKRFIFASSSAASQFPGPGKFLTEESSLDADYDYAVSKKRAEELIKEFSQWFPCTVVRFAAVFSDWCEYGPLYMFLSTWLSKGWNSRILGGEGESGVPYIHTTDLNKLIFSIIGKHSQLDNFNIFLASPNGSTSHKDLFRVATDFFFGKKIKPIFIPKLIATPGVLVRYIFGKLIGKPPFEKPWMLKYLDLKLDIDSSKTQKILNWSPSPRLSIQRRLLFLIENMKSDPNEWELKNKRALKKDSFRPNLLIYNSMIKLKEKIVIEIFSILSGSEENRDRFESFLKVNRDVLRKDIEFIYQLLAVSIRTKDRLILLDYSKDIGYIRHEEGVKLEEIVSFIDKMGDIIVNNILEDLEIKNLMQLLYDRIKLTLEMAIDEISDIYEKADVSKYLQDLPKREDIENRIGWNKTLPKFYPW